MKSRAGAHSSSIEESLEKSDASVQSHMCIRSDANVAGKSQVSGREWLPNNSQ